MHYSSIIFVTKYSRVPQEKIALFNYNVRLDVGVEPVVIQYEAYETILNSFYIQCKKLGLKILACNILPDHVHLLIGHNSIAISQYVRKLKGYSSFLYNKRFNSTRAGGGKQNTLRAKGYSNTKMVSPNHRKNTISYINRNHYKHAKKRGDSLIENYERHLKQKLVKYNRLL